jgi:CMP/dCMP kinase
VKTRPLIVAIDSPAGVGKSATARELAFRLGVPYLDTGAMYRAVALLAMRAGFTPPLGEEQIHAVIGFAHACRIEFTGHAGQQSVLLDGEDVTQMLRGPEVSTMASVVSAIGEIRTEMVKRQRELAAKNGGVIEGRDIGTVVFPDASVKIFLTARPEVRAQRRFDELTKKGCAVSWDAVLHEQLERDQRDTTRPVSPLRPADDAVVLDSSQMKLQEVVGRVLELVKEAP